jgi:hypothetical protein
MADEVWSMILQKKLIAYSLGGQAIVKVPVCNGKCFWRIDKLDIHEISYVDKPANPGASFVILKEADIKKMETQVVELNRVLSQFNHLVLFKDYISIVGSTVEKGAGKDLDILVRDSAESPLRRHIETRLLKSLPELANSIHFIWGDVQGPHDTHMPLYDLVLLRRTPKVISMVVSKEDERTIDLEWEHFPADYLGLNDEDFERETKRWTQAARDAAVAARRAMGVGQKYGFKRTTAVLDNDKDNAVDFARDLFRAGKITSPKARFNVYEAGDGKPRVYEVMGAPSGASEALQGPFYYSVGNGKAEGPFLEPEEAFSGKPLGSKIPTRVAHSATDSPTLISREREIHSNDKVIKEMAEEKPKESAQPEKKETVPPAPTSVPPAPPAPSVVPEEKKVGPALPVDKSEKSEDSAVKTESGDVMPLLLEMKAKMAQLEDEMKALKAKPTEKPYKAYPEEKAKPTEKPYDKYPEKKEDVAAGAPSIPPSLTREEVEKLIEEGINKVGKVEKRSPGPNALPGVDLSYQKLAAMPWHDLHKLAGSG